MASFQHNKRSDKMRCTWNYGEVFFLSRIWLYFYLQGAVVNIPIQTVIFSPWRFLRNEIISQLELGAFASLNLPINESVWGRHLVVHLKNSRRHDHLGHFSRFETFFWISKESWIANYFWVLNKSFLEKVILVIVFQIYNNFSIRIYF